MRAYFAENDTGNMIISDVFLVSLSPDRLKDFTGGIEKEARRRNLVLTRQEVYNGMLLRWFPASNLQVKDEHA